MTYAVGGDGLVNGDMLSGALATSAAGTSSVGNYAVTQGTLAASANYDLTYVGGVLTVDARPITVTADDLTRHYGDANPSLTYAVGGEGLVNGDALSGALVTAATTTSNVGGYAITQGTLASSTNYALTYVGGILTVDARPIMIAANDQSRVYGDANPALTYAVGGDGLVNGDMLSGALVTAATTTSNVGGYAITQGSLASSANYNHCRLHRRHVDRDAGALSVRADDIASVSLDAATPTASYTGFVLGQDSSIVTGLEYGLFPVADDPLKYNIVPFGATAPNYAIIYFAGLLTLTPVVPNGSTAPLISDGGYHGPSSFTLTGSLGTFTLSNVVTGTVGSDDNVLLFQVGLPGTISPFKPVSITDFSNAIDATDRLLSAG